MATNDSVANLLLRITGDTSDAQGNLAGLLASLGAVDRTDAEAEVDVKTAGAQAALAALAAELTAISGREVNIDVDIDRGGAGRAALTGLTSGLQAAAGGAGGMSTGLRSINFGPFTLGSGAASIAALGLAAILGTALVAALAAVIASLTAAVGALGALGVAFAAALGPGIVLAIALFARLGAIMEAYKAQEQAADQAAQQGAQGQQQAAAAAEQRIQAANQLRDAIQGLATAIRNLNEAEAQAEEAIRRAQVAEEDAARAVKRARRDLTDARKEATEAIQQSSEREVDASRAVGRAVQRLAEAEKNARRDIEQAIGRQASAQQRANDATARLTAANERLAQEAVNAYRAWEDAVEDVEDAIRGVADAQAGIDRSAEGIRNAERQLTLFRKGARLTASEFDSLFATLTNLDFDFSFEGMQALLAGAGVVLDTKQLTELEETILGVRDARLAEAGAVDALGDATTRLNTARGVEQQFIAQGIEAYAPYRGAVDAVTEAEKGLETATQAVVTATNELAAIQALGVAGAPAVVAATDSLTEARKRETEAAARASELEALGLARAPAVIAAREQLADSERRLIEARREANRLEELGITKAPAVISAMEGVRDATEAVAEARRRSDKAGDLTGLSTGAAKAQVALSKLSGAERAFLDQMRVTVGYLKSFFQPAVDAIFGGLTEYARNLPNIMGPLQGAFTALGGRIGQMIGQIGRELARPAWTSAFISLIDGARQLVGPLTTILILGMRFFRDLAVAAMPFLVEGMKAAAAALRSFIAGIGGTKGFTDFLELVMPQLGSWLSLLFQLSRVFFAFVGIAMGPGKTLVDMFAEGARQLANWMQSAEGRKAIKQFFTDTLPLVIQLVPLLLRLAVVLLQLTQAAAPGLAIIFEGMNLILSVASKVMGFFSGLLRSLGLTEAASLAMISPIGALVFAFLSLGGVAETVWNAIKTAAQAAASVVTAVWNVAKTTLTATWNAIKTAASAIWNAIKVIATSVWNAIKVAITTPMTGAWAAVKLVWDTAKSGLTLVWNAIKSVATASWNAIKDSTVGPVRTAAEWVGDRFDRLRDKLAGVWGSIRDSASRTWGRIKEAVTGPIDAAWERIKGLASDFYEAGKNLIQSLIDGITGAATSLYNRAREIAQNVRDILPFSEPRDPRSPLRNLESAGEAIFANIAAGFPGGAAVLDNALRAELSGLSLAIPSGGPTPAQQVTQNYNIPVHAPLSGGQPDAVSTVALIEQRLRERGGLRI